MAQALLTFRGGALEIPNEVKEHFHLTEGARLRLTFASDSVGTLETETPAEPERRGWRAFRGLLKDQPARSTEEARAEERDWERGHDERNYGISIP